MSAAILNFVRRSRPSEDWSDGEVAEFFRVAEALRQSGFAVVTERGMTDEGDPWFIFVRESTDEVIAHFARINGEFIADASTVTTPVRGRDLRHVLDQIMNHYTVLVPRPKGDNLFMHPAALLTAFVATALMELQNASQRTLGGEDIKNATRVEAGTGRAPTAPATATAPANTAGRAVSFNEQGGFGDSFGTGTHHVFTAVLTALTLADMDFGTGEGAAAGEDLLRLTDAAVLEAAGAGSARLIGATGQDESFGPPLRESAEAEGSAAAPDRTPEPATAIDVPATISFIVGEPGADGDGDIPAPASISANAGGAHLDALDPADSPVADTDSPTAQSAEREAAREESFDLDLVSFGRVTLHVDALEVIFAPADGARHNDLVQLGDGAAVVDDDGEPVEVAPSLSAGELVFTGTSSQNETLRDIVDYVQESRQTPETMTFDDRTFVGQTAMIYARQPSDLPDIVAFESDSIQMTAFAFMPGVIFVKEKALGTGVPDFDGASHTVDLDDGGTVSLLGVVSFDNVFG